MTLLAAFQVLLPATAARTISCVGTPIANRTRAEIEGLIGFFVNTLVLRTDLSGNPTLPRAAAAGARGLPGRLRPPGSAVRAAGRGAAARARPEPHTRCSRSCSCSRTRPLPALRAAGPDAAAAGGRQRDGQVRPDAVADRGRRTGWRACWSTTPTCSTRRRSRGWLGTSRRCWRASSPTPISRVAALPLLTEAERRQLLVEWNATARRLPAPSAASTSCSRPRPRARPTPSRWSASGAAADLPRAERARQPAGAPPAQRWASGRRCWSASAWSARWSWWSALLGILKAGGAYVPLDPAYPAERLAVHAGGCSGRGAADHDERGDEETRRRGERVDNPNAPLSPLLYPPLLIGGRSGSPIGPTIAQAAGDEPGQRRDGRATWPM